jgi:integrase
MIEFVFKPSGARLYSGRYRLDGERKISTVRLHVSDKQVAKAKLRALIVERERQAAGLLPSASELKSSTAAISEHLDAFLGYKSRTRDARYLYELKNRVLVLVRECGWKIARDITPESFELWRQNRKGCAKTLNEYLISIRALMNWMVTVRRIAENPLLIVERYPSDGLVRPRRALNDDEAHRLLDVAKERRTLYHTALQTGSRRGELTQLEVRDLDLHSIPAKITFRGSTTKNGKTEPVPLRDDLATELRAFINGRALNQSDKIFASVIPTMNRFRADLKAAGIAFINADGARADFHALRHTFCTNLQRSGVGQRVLMSVMRHGDRRLSDHVYTDSKLLPVAAAVEALPSFAAIQMPTPKADTNGHSGSLAVAQVSAAEHTASLSSRGNKHEETPVVADSRKSGDGARYRVRTCDPYRVKVVLYH